MCFSPDGRILASGSSDSTIRLWDVTTGAIRKTLAGHTGAVMSMSFSPDGLTLASGSSDNTVSLWNVTTVWDIAIGAPRKTFTGHIATVSSVHFSPDGLKLASGSEAPDGTLLLWPTASARAAAAPRFATDVNGNGVVNIRETSLLPNYPNPFNPETWIPYQLAEPAEITVSIYSVNGTLVRKLDLGHQTIGIYRGRSRAAYWDGKNEFGERVASGVYFYTLTAGNFSATRKMMIQK